MPESMDGQEVWTTFELIQEVTHWSTALPGPVQDHSWTDGEHIVAPWSAFSEKGGFLTWQSHTCLIAQGGFDTTQLH